MGSQVSPPKPRRQADRKRDIGHENRDQNEGHLLQPYIVFIDFCFLLLFKLKFLLDCILEVQQYYSKKGEIGILRLRNMTYRPSFY